MSCCTFFGHKSCPDINEDDVLRTIIKAITDNGADTFYVGNNGSFDRLVINALTKIQTNYYRISWYIVLAYMPVNTKILYDNTIYPEALEFIPQKYCIEKRNLWMINKSDIVITHVIHHYGGAAKFMKIAKKKGKIIINI